MDYRQSAVNNSWWDLTTLDQDLTMKAASLTLEDLKNLSNERCKVVFYDDLDDMFLSQALEYITTWQKATKDNPVGICGPIGPTRQLPIVAKLVNALNIDLKYAHFWGMDEWLLNDKTIPTTNPLSFSGANMRLWYNKIKPELRMPLDNLHFPTKNNLDLYSKSFSEYKCLIMQGGLGHTLHWAFNEPPKRYLQETSPMEAQQYSYLGAREVDLHPISQIQNATGLSGRDICQMPDKAVTVGPKETFMCDHVSIWYPGHNQNPFGLKLAIYLVSNNIRTSAAPISILAEHESITFHVYRPSIIDCLAKIR